MAPFLRLAKRAPVTIASWFAALILAVPAIASAPPPSRHNLPAPRLEQAPRAKPLHLPLAFEPNVGQGAAQVQFLAHGPGYAVALNASGMQFRVHGRARAARSQLAMRLVDADPRAVGRGRSPLPGRVNYFIGADPSRWHRNVPTYAQVEFRDVYPRTDLVYHGRQGQMEFDFVLGPGADPGRIHLAVDGNAAPRLGDSGELGFGGGFGGLLFKRPVAYQEIGGTRKAIAAAFVLKQHALRFRVGPYDHTRPLIIDPVVSYSTLLGSTAEDAATAVATDATGDRYVAGNTQGANDFTSVAAGTRADDPGTWDVWVIEIDPSGFSVLYSAFIGGSGNDFATAITLDGSGNAYVTGNTNSPTFPGALVNHTIGSQNGFVFKLDNTGTLAYAQYLGGSGAASATAVQFYTDSSGNRLLYVAGSTAAPSGICTPAGQGDGYVVRLDSATGAQLGAICIGGSSYDQINALAVSASGSIYFGGITGSSDLRVTPHAYQGAYHGGAYDGMVGELASDLTLSYLTYLGGSGDDYVNGIAVDSNGDAYVTGKTSSSTTAPAGSSIAVPFPTTQSGVQPTYQGGTYDAFVTEFNPGGTGLVYSTYFGGNGDDEGKGITLDATNDIWIVGSTTSSNLPLLNALQQQLQGSSDGFMAEFAAGGDAVTFSSYLGGSNDDTINAVVAGAALDPNTGLNENFILMAGTTSSLDFPSVNGFQAYTGAGDDCFVLSLTYGESAATRPDISVTIADKPGPVTISVATVYDITIINNGPGDASNVAVFDAVKNGILSGVSPSQGFCSRLNLTTTCVLGTIAAGSAAGVAVQVIPNTLGTMTDTAAFVYADQTDANPSNNSDSMTTLVVDTSGGYGAVSYCFLGMAVLGLFLRRPGCRG